MASRRVRCKPLRWVGQLSSGDRVLRRILIAVLAIVVVAGGGFFAWAWHGELPAEPSREVSTFDPAVVAKGANLVAIGSCAVCHTAKNSPSFAGGYPVETPFGVIYGSNITPDRDTGIGTWSPAAFRRAMREGVDRLGNHLYPAFPYDHFTHATDSDLDAVYAFLMTRNAVQKANREPALAFPFNIRLSAAAWKLLFLHPGPNPPDPSKSAEWNRGAYLAESFGHCGACHTPRNLLAGEQRGKAYDGGFAEGWLAPALNAKSPAAVPWTAEAVTHYLREGWDAEHGHAAGPMAPVIDGTSRANSDDLRALGVYVASLNGATAAEIAAKREAALEFAAARTLPAHGTTAQTTGAAPGLANDGTAIFAGACATCHHAGGELPISRPIDLSLSSTVNEADARDLIQVILRGIHPATNERGRIMPAFDGVLTDRQIVALVNYVRGHFSTQPMWSDPAKTLANIRNGKGS